MKKTNCKPVCPLCGSKIALTVYAATGYDSSISASGSLLAGETEVSVYKCTHGADICLLARKIFELYTHHPLSVRGGWRKALARYHQFDEFCIDNPTLIHKLKASSDEHGSISKEMQELFISEATPPPQTL